MDQEPAGLTFSMALEALRGFCFLGTEGSGSQGPLLSLGPTGHAV